MSEVFGPDAARRAQREPVEPKPAPPADGRAPGEGPQGVYMQYDNEMGAMMLDLPARFAKYKGELEEDLMDAFYGDAAGGKTTHQSINEWIAEWIRKKEAEDPDLASRRPDLET